MQHTIHLLLRRVLSDSSLEQVSVAKLVSNIIVVTRSTVHGTNFGRTSQRCFQAEAMSVLKVKLWETYYLTLEVLGKGTRRYKHRFLSAGHGLNSQEKGYDNRK